MSNRPVPLRGRFHRLKVSALLVAAAILFASAASRAQVAFDNAQISLASFSSTHWLSPVAVDAQGDAFFVASNSTSNALYEAPVNGSLITLNSAFPFSPSAIAANPQGTRLFFIYTASKASCDGVGSVVLASAPVSAGTTPANMPCSFSLSGTTVTYTNPTGLAVDPSSNLWIADFGGGDFFEIPAPVSASSVPANFVALSSGQPYDVAVNGDGNVYFTVLAFGTSSETLDVDYIPASSLTSSISGSPVAPGSIAANVPSIQSGLAIDPFGNLYLGGGTSADSLIFRGGLNPVYSNFVNGTYGLAIDPSGDLYIAGAAANGGQSVIELGLLSVNFGKVALGSTSQTWTLNFTVNSGTAVNSIAVLTTGIAGLDFAAAGDSTCTAETYSATTNCTVNVNFKPQGIGERRGSVVFYDASNNELANVPISGIGTGPQVIYQGGTQTTFGTGLSVPYGLKIDAAGNVYLADGANSRVLKITPGGTQSTVGSGFDQPTDVAIDGAGNVYITDGANNALYEVTPAGVQTTVETGLSAPWGVAIDGAGNLYVGEESSGSVFELTPGGVQFNVATGLNLPYGVAVDSAGDLFIADCGSGNVYEVTPVGKKTTRASGLTCPSYVALDPSGNLYVTEYASNGTVAEITSDAIVSLAIDISGPYGVALDSGGNLYFTQSADDSQGYKIERATPPTLSFLTTAGGSKSTDSPKVVTLQNIGNTVLDFSEVSFPKDFPEGSNDSDCTSSTALVASGECTVTIDFLPVTVEGMSTTIPLSESVQVNTDSLNATTQQVVAVSGTETKSVQVITFAAPPSATYGETLNLDLYARSSAPVTLTFTVVSGPATVSGSTVTFTGLGPVVIQASQPGTGAYAAAISVNAIITVTKAVLTVTANNLSRVYGVANPTLTDTISGFLNGDTSSVVSGAPLLVTTATVSTPVGSYPIAIGPGTLSATNYTFNLVHGTLTILRATPAITWDVPSAITYDTALSATQLDASSPVAGKFAYSPPAGTKLDAGKHSLTAVFTPTDTTNYETTLDSVVLTVDKRTLRVTADSVSVLYDKPLPELKCSVEGFVNGDTTAVLKGSPRETTTAVKGSPVGTYPIKISQGTLAAANYKFAFKDGTLTIKPAGPTATPEFKQAAGTYPPPLNVTITDATPGAVIYYALHGLTPSTASTKYTGPIAVTGTETIKAIAVAPDYTESAVATATYTVD